MPLLSEVAIPGVSSKEEGETVKLQFVGNSLSNKHVAIQATSPWKYDTSDNTVYYYEIRITTTANAVGAGLAVADFPTTTKMPGWLAGSYAYHGDDGNRFVGGSGKRGWSTFSAGDVVGIGLKASTGEIFGTLNGKYLGVVATISEEKLAHFPTIGFDSPAEVDVLFSKNDFLFDVATLPATLIPLFGSLETDMAETKLIVLFLNDVEATEAEKLKKVVEHVAQEAKSKHGYQSLYTGGSELATSLREHIGLTRSPLLIVVDLGKKSHKFAYPEDQAITSEGLSAFLASIASGTVAPVRKSAARPPNDRNPDHPSIVQVVGGSFEELVLQGPKDVLLDVYADWCGPCKAIAPTIALLADTLEGNETIVIAKLDCDANDVDRTYIPETSIPNIKFFGAADKSKPVKYEGNRSLDSFLEFLHSNATVKFDLEATKEKGKRLAEEQEKKLLKNVKHVETTEAFNEFLKQTDNLVIVDYFATWCPPCKAIAPLYADLSEQYKDVLFLKVNVDLLTDVARDQGISCMPTFKVYKKGKEAGTLEGASPTELKELITKNL